MSNLFNYNAAEVAKAYDRTRNPSGVDIIAGLLHIYCGKHLKDIHLLDAGCGTGQYAKALVDMGIGRISLLDASRDMLNVAETKLKDAITKNVVDVGIQAALPDLPFKEGTFDAVMYNLVLHHLDKARTCSDFPQYEKTLLQSRRILRKNGVLVVTTCLPSALKKSFWFSQIHPDICDILSKLHPSLKLCLDLFAKYGFKCVSAMNLLPIESSQFTFSDFLNPESPLNEEWRIGSSMLKVAGPEKEKELIEIVKDMKKAGTLDKFVSDHDHTSEMGGVTLFVCVCS